MVDVVANHMGPENGDFNSLSLFNQPHHYHPSCQYGNSPNQWDLENCRIAGVLPDLNTEDGWVIFQLYKWIHWLVKEFSFDGIRIDTVKHVRKDFWPGFVRASGVFAMGEVFDGNPKYLGEYQSGMDSIFNYAMYYTINDVFGKNRGSMWALESRINQVRETHRDVSLLGSFLDNHDNPRFMAMHHDRLSLRNAVVFTLMTEGIPIIYYGTEHCKL